MGPRRHALRLATRGLHGKLDGLIGRFSDLGAYSSYLLVSTAFRASVEAELQPEAVRAAGLSPLSLVEELHRDRRDLGLTEAAGPTEAGLGCHRSAHLGALYVLEGASMGARVLMADAERIGLSGSFGARHLARQVAAAGRWPRFLLHLEDMQDFDLQGGIAGACKAFELAIALAEVRHGAQ